MNDTNKLPSEDIDQNI